MDLIRPNRREFLGALAACSLFPAFANQRGENLPPVRRITRGPKFHWFGYYDKWQFDPSSRYVLGMEVDFEHRCNVYDFRVISKGGWMDDKDKSGTDGQRRGKPKTASDEIDEYSIC